MPPPPSRHPAPGQASLEYAGLLTLVVAVLAAASPAAAGLSGVGARVSSAVRTGICIVGGDICRTADAVAAGLDPCTLTERLRGGRLAATVLSIRLGDGEELAVAQRSDGSVAVTRSGRNELGLSGGIGFEAGPLKAGAEGGMGLAVSAAVGWELPDAAAAARLVADMRRGLAYATARHRPAWRSGDAGLAASGWAGLGLAAGGGAGGGIGAGAGGGGGVEVPGAGIAVAAESAAGARIGRGTTTLYLRAGTGGPSISLPGTRAGSGGAGPVLVEYTRDAGGARELAFRAAARAGDGGRIVETVARMDLRVPENRAVAERLLRLPAPWPATAAAAAAQLRAAIRHTAATGTVERNVYRVADRSVGLELAGRLGTELGVELSHTRVDRTLVGATVTTAGSRPRAREDCVR